MISTLSLLALFACTDDTTTSMDTGHGSHGNHAETCGDEGDHYMAGMVASGTEGLVDLTLVDADPGPPEKGDNLLVLSLAWAADDSPVEGASVVLRPWMPEHGHGSSPETFAVTASTDPGAYETEPVNLFMGGLWELMFEVETLDGDTDSATFTFCVEG